MVIRRNRNWRTSSLLENSGESIGADGCENTSKKIAKEYGVTL